MLLQILIRLNKIHQHDLPMLAAVWHGLRDIRVEDLPKPSLRSDEVLIHVRACGICATDVHIFDGTVTYATPPVILGHEFSGEVTEVGESVTGLAVGDRVAVDPNRSCGACVYCRAGAPNFCTNLMPYGVKRNGGFAEQCVVGEAAAIHLPLNLTHEEAAFVEPVSCACHCIRLAGIEPGSAVAVFGPGPAGIVLVQLAKAAGASPVICVGTKDDRLQKATELGADATINVGSEDYAARILELTNGMGVDVAIDAAGRKPSMVQAITSVRKGGRVVVFGVAREEEVVEVSPFQIVSRGIKVFGSWLNPFSVLKAVKVIALGTVKVTPLISHRFPLEKMSEAMNVAELRPPGTLKTLVLPP